MDYQWYPGHMTKARRAMQEDIKLVDLVIELADARIPLASRNPDIDQLASGKARILLLNKSDLADPAQNVLWQEYFSKQGIYTALIDSRERRSARIVGPLIEEASREKRERDRRRGIVNRPVRAMICGIPNVGKSTFINSYAGRASAKTGNKPGVTRGKQWIRPGKNVELLDTPGILWPKLEDQEAGVRLAAVGSIRDEIMNTEELACWVISYCAQQYPGSLAERYGIEEQGTPEELLLMTAKARGALRKDGELDSERSAALILDDLRSGRLGRLTLERCSTE